MKTSDESRSRVSGNLTLKSGTAGNGPAQTARATASPANGPLDADQWGEQSPVPVKGSSTEGDNT